MIRRLWLLALLVALSGSCARGHLRPPPPKQPGQQRFLVPLYARNGDLICAETVTAEPNVCRRVEDFRRWIFVVRAEP